MIELGNKVKVIKHKNNPRYVGLIGKVIWINNTGELLQIETETKPPYYRPAHGRYIITVYPEGLELLAK